MYICVYSYRVFIVETVKAAIVALEMSMCTYYANCTLVLRKTLLYRVGFHMLEPLT